MAKWFGAHYNQEVRFSSAVKCKKGSQVLTSLLNQRRNYYYYVVRKYKLTLKKAGHFFKLGDFVWRENALFFQHGEHLPVLHASVFWHQILHCMENCGPG